MSAEMQPMRQIAGRVLRSSVTQAWLFEDTPASPDAADTAYIDAVGRSDIFIWLVAGATSEAVELEVSEALRRNLPMLVFQFPAETLDERSMRLLDQVRSTAKYKRITRLAEFERELSLALTDLLVQAVRERRATRAVSALERLQVQLRGIALGRWQAVGVPLEMALDLMDDSRVGSAAPSQLPSTADKVVILAGEVGSGKSIAAVRFALTALQVRALDPGAPVPVWVATERRESINEALARSTDIDDPLRVGCCIVVDGADEHGAEAHLRYLEQALAASATHLSTTVLLTSRSGEAGALARIPSKQVVLLSLDEALQLMNRCFGLSLGQWAWHDWPPAVQDAAKRPLFALLLGRHLSEGGSVAGSTPARLMDALVRAALAGTGEADDAFEQLAALAVQSIEADGQPIAPSDAGTSRQRDLIVRSRLVTDSAGGIAFALPLLREWFGAQAIETGQVAPDELTRDEVQIERWRYSIIIATAVSSRAATDELLAQLARVSPGFASEVIDAAVSKWRVEPRNLHVQSGAVEHSYRLAYSAFLDGFDPLRDLLLPAGARSLDDVAVGVHDGSFYRGVPRSRAAVDLSAVYPADVPGGWHSILTTRVSPEAMWPWRRARDDIKDRLERLMMPFHLLVPAMDDELTWAAAVALTGGRTNLYAPIARSAVRDRLGAMDGIASIETRHGVVVPLKPLRHALEPETEDPLVCPYPDRDGPLGGWIWSGFSSVTLLERSRLVYRQALRIYAELVETFLPALGGRLELNALRPMRFVGRLIPSPVTGGEATLSYYLLPLPNEEADDVSLELGAAEFGWEGLDALGEAIASRRPHRPWLGAAATTGRVEVYGSTPASDLAFDWLRTDLRRLGWH